MSALGLVLIVLGGLVIYEAIKGGIGTAKAAAPAAPAGSGGTGVTSVPATGTLGAIGGSIPAAWIDALARHESPSIFTGDFSFGAFGLSCGAGQGYAVGCTPPLPSKDPNDSTTPPLDIFPNVGAAVNGLTAWVTRNAPEAFGATTCSEFMAILQEHGYGNLSGTC